MVTESLIEHIQGVLKALEAINHFSLTNDERRHTVDVGVLVKANKTPFSWYAFL
jgi:hypothetical protein